MATYGHMVELGKKDVFLPMELNFIKVWKNIKPGILQNYLRELKLVVPNVAFYKIHKDQKEGMIHFSTVSCGAGMRWSWIRDLKICSSALELVKT